MNDWAYLFVLSADSRYSAGGSRASPKMLADFEPRREDAAAFAKVRRVLLMDYAPGIKLRTCSAEDLIVYKAFANRDLDWIDVKGILVRQQGELQFDVIEQELRLLVHLKESA